MQSALLPTPDAKMAKLVIEKSNLDKAKVSKVKEGFKKYDFDKMNPKDMVQRSLSFYQELDKRRSIRHFSNEEIPDEVIYNILKTASTAPSGAHKQPWFFAIVKSSEIKKEIRNAAEKEEYVNYHGRMGKEWIKDLEKFETNWEKPYLENAPVLIVVFKKSHDVSSDRKQKNYYVNESVGIASGMLIAAIHHAGLACLTHTPSPMNFLSKILNRPSNEKPFLLIPIGYPDDNSVVPVLKRKSLEEISNTF